LQQLDTHIQLNAIQSSLPCSKLQNNCNDCNPGKKAYRAVVKHHQAKQVKVCVPVKAAQAAAPAAQHSQVRLAQQRRRFLCIRVDWANSVDHKLGLQAASTGDAAAAAVAAAGY
jgi:hypothetical protein